jgi:hypothetical protein
VIKVHVVPQDTRQEDDISNSLGITMMMHWPEQVESADCSLVFCGCMEEFRVYLPPDMIESGQHLARQLWAEHIDQIIDSRIPAASSPTTK